MKRSALLCALMMFSFSNPSFAFFWNENDLKREILSLHAIMDVSEYAAQVGSVWTRDRKSDEQNAFDKEADTASQHASGRTACLLAHREAAELVSREVVWMYAGINGMDKAHTIAYQYEWTNLYHSAINAAKLALSSGADAEHVGIASAKESFRFMMNIEEKIREKIQNELSCFYLARSVNYPVVLQVLKAPLETEEFTKHTLPEIQEYYKTKVSLIEEKMKDLQLL